MFKTFFNTQLPLNENENNCDENLNGINYNRTVRKLHDTGWKKSSLILVMFLCLVMDVVCHSILNFTNQDLEKYQVLLRPCLGYFEGDIGEF